MYLVKYYDNAYFGDSPEEAIENYEDCTGRSFQKEYKENNIELFHLQTPVILEFKIILTPVIKPKIINKRD
jgi:hypothetical protein